MRLFAAAAFVLVTSYSEELKEEQTVSGTVAPLPAIPVKWTPTQVKKASLYNVRKAVRATVVEESAKIDGELKRMAVRRGRAAASYAAKAAATKGTLVAAKRTKALLMSKAQQYCAKISTLKSLPALCGKEAAVLFGTLKSKGHMLEWRNEAETAAVIAASKAAAVAAYRGTSKTTQKELLPLAMQVAEKKFKSEYARGNKQWQAYVKKNAARIAQEKKQFFDRFTQRLIAQTSAAARKKIWGLAKGANIRLNNAARKQAEITSLNTVSTHLAPLFASAAAKALPIAVRQAAKKALQQWQPRQLRKAIPQPKLAFHNAEAPVQIQPRFLRRSDASQQELAEESFSPATAAQVVESSDASVMPVESEPVPQDMGSPLTEAQAASSLDAEMPN
eukprot:CAMPEP_0204367574 /NCGR_PEP_ID=MMETSP0469-20131031/43519_1 /ASSEMBLY_ACC=CAM_ASM_000384 /TAXON_ID=2969 /ORGANISM="Oxyrrhis marina" /LENGTH=390 /DNA_ID=CAMNT_0051357005 /DNA_START=81 /DNA_END=1253 /DNA_ORIENTATION=+